MTNRPEKPNRREDLTFLNPEIEQLSMPGMDGGELPDAGGTATVLNRELREPESRTIPDSVATAMNRDLKNSTVLNPQLSHPVQPLQENSLVRVLHPSGGDSRREAVQDGEPDSIPAGTMLCGHWRVEERLPGQSGEAVLYRCTWDGAADKTPGSADSAPAGNSSGTDSRARPDKGAGACVAKVYRRSSSIKREILDRLLTLRSPWVAPLYAHGVWKDHTVTILPFYARGSLQGRTISYETLKAQVIPCLNDGLHALHGTGILHKDLKPSNIMLTDEACHVAIIDFGISSAFEDGNTVMITRTGMTPVYSAPEMFRNLAVRESDYYSMGVTLYELFSGGVPYAGMSGEEIARHLSIQRFPLPDDMPGDLRDLIRALTYPDISGRGERENPNRRWGYEEVKQWLAGMKQPIPGAAEDKKEPYQFCGAEYDSRSKLAEALVLHWEEGKKHLFRGRLSAWFRERDAAAYEICRQGEERRRTSGWSEDRVFWETVWDLTPRRRDFFWKGTVYTGLPHFGEALLEGLRAERKDVIQFAGSVLEEGLLSRYAERVGLGIAEKSALAAMEHAHQTYRKRRRDQMVNYYKVGFRLSGQKTLYFVGRQFRTVRELTGFLRKLAEGEDNSLQRVREFCYQMVDRDNQLDPQLEAWLWVHGKEDALSYWQDRMSG